MVEATRLVGIEKRSYRGQDGKEKSYCGLHLLDYEMYNTRNGKAARLVDLLPVEEPGAKK